MNISDYLAAQALSQEAFAKRIGVSQGRVSQWIRGEKIPPERAELIEIETAGAVRVEVLRPDLHWQRDPAGKVLGYFKKSRPASVPEVPPAEPRPPARRRGAADKGDAAPADAVSTPLMKVA